MTCRFLSRTVWTFTTLLFAIGLQAQVAKAIVGGIIIGGAVLGANKHGPFVLALNAIDYRNYKGYFDLVIQVPEN